MYTDATSHHLIITTEHDKESFEIIDLGKQKKYGCGGSKCAFYLNEDVALVLPNRWNFGASWRRMVKEEILASTFLTNVGIMNPHHQLVTISVFDNDNQTEEKYPAYISNSFEGLYKRSDILVLDLKEASHLKFAKPTSFFYQPNDAQDPKNWTHVLEPLFRDILILNQNNIAFGMDTVNFAIVPNESPSLLSKSQIRFYGFDFSSKSFDLDWISSDAKTSTRDFTGNWANQLLNTAIQELVWTEMWAKLGKNLSSLTPFYKELADKMEKYFEPFLTQLETPVKPIPPRLAELNQWIQDHIKQVSDNNKAIELPPDAKDWFDDLDLNWNQITDFNLVQRDDSVFLVLTSEINWKTDKVRYVY